MANCKSNVLRDEVNYIIMIRVTLLQVIRKNSEKL